MIKKFLVHLITITEAFVKGLIFDCRRCGQCILRKTGLICPMTCPKGLRNGPCGGTTNGKCEVKPEMPCVWVRIHARAGNNLEAFPINPSMDYHLNFTSSYINYFNGKDKPARTSLPPIDIPYKRVGAPLQTNSKLEQAFKSKEKRFVFTCEVRSPRDYDFSGVERELAIIKEEFDAVNATAFLAGKPSVSSLRTAEILKKYDIEPIAQATCRDHTKSTFISELIEAAGLGVNNMLCLTGDSYAGSPKMKQIWDMDSAIMLYEARYLRETGKMFFCNEKTKRVPKIFLGGAINPFTTPVEIPIRRLKQKINAGVDFIQSQLIFDMEMFDHFMGYYHQEEIHHSLFFLAGIPVVTSKKAIEHMAKIPGVVVPEKVLNEYLNCEDIRSFGIAKAQAMMQEISYYEGINGFHLMLLGSDHSALPEVINPFKERN